MPREFPLPGTVAVYAPDRTCDVVHYRIEVDLDVESKAVAGKCAVTVTPVGGPMQSFTLDALEFEVERVSSPTVGITHHYDGEKLRVELDKPVPLGADVTVVVDYRTTPRRGLYFVGPDDAYPDKPVQVWTQGQDEDSRFWFPCFDTPRQKATSEVIAVVPNNFFALSNGALVADETTGDRRRIHWKFDERHSCYLVTLAAAEFAVVENQWNGLDVHFYVAPGREDDAVRAFGKTPEMLALFSRLFGVPYPYNKYAQVAVADFIFGGMENTTATTMTDIVLFDERAALDWECEGLVAHELAHQWFGDLLTCRDWGEGWLNEGFATYSEYLWREHSEGADAGSLELDAWAGGYFGEDAARYRRTVATNVYDEPIDIFDAHLYEKGGRVLHMLRQILGDDAFFEVLRNYIERHRFGTVETRDFARACEDTTGRVLDWFFDQWITRGAGHPELKVGYEWDAAAKTATVKVKQTQKVEGLTPLFRLPTKVRFRIAGKSASKTEDLDFDVELRDTEHTFVFPLASEPSHVIFDPGKQLLAKVDFEKAPALWIAQLQGATAAIDRIFASRALAKRGGAKAVQALSKAALDDPFFGAQAAAATALGKIRTEAALAGLLAAVDIPHPKARRAVVRALGEFRTTAAADVLISIIERGDRSYFVEAEACLALGKTRDPRASDTLRGAQDRDSFLDVIRQHVYRGFAVARDESAIDLLVGATAYGGSSMARRAAVGAIAELCRGNQAKFGRVAIDTFIELLRDRDFRVQSTAIEALGKLGDSAAIGPLAAFVDSTIDGRHRRRGREVLRDLREGRATSDQLRQLTDQVEQLTGRVSSLGERMEKMETATGSGKVRKGTRAAKTKTKTKTRAKAKATKARATKAKKTAAKASKAATKAKKTAATKTATRAKRGKAAAKKTARKPNGRTATKSRAKNGSRTAKSGKTSTRKGVSSRTRRAR